MPKDKFLEVVRKINKLKLYRKTGDVRLIKEQLDSINLQLAPYNKYLNNDTIKSRLNPTYNSRANKVAGGLAG